MAAINNYALRVPVSLMQDLRAAAERDGVSMNSFIIQAAAEKVAALRARGFLGDLSVDQQEAYLSERAQRGKKIPMGGLLAKAGTTDQVREGDEVPEGWLDEQPDGKPQAIGG